MKMEISGIDEANVGYVSVYRLTNEISYASADLLSGGNVIRLRMTPAACRKLRKQLAYAESVFVERGELDGESEDREEDS